MKDTVLKNLSQNCPNMISLILNNCSVSWTFKEILELIYWELFNSQLQI